MICLSTAFWNESFSLKTTVPPALFFTLVCTFCFPYVILPIEHTRGFSELHKIKTNEGEEELARRICRKEGTEGGNSTNTTGARATEHNRHRERQATNPTTGSPAR